MSTTDTGRARLFQVPRPPPAHQAFEIGQAAPPRPGDHAPAFQLPDHGGKVTSPWDVRLCGRPAALVFRQGASGPGFASELCAFRDEHTALARHRALVFAVTDGPLDANRALHRECRLNFPVLMDPRGAVHRGYGLDRASDGPITVLLDANRRVEAVIAGAANAPQATRALRVLDDAAAVPTATRLGAHPPVLVVPRALEHADCARLIEHWHKPVTVWQPEPTRPCPAYQAETGDFKLRERLYGSVVQMVVRDAEIQSHLDRTLMRRLIPEIENALQTTITHREAYRIACYDAAEDGGLPQHRDNNSAPTGHRRFTASVVLNAGDYDGGQLRFREFGEQLYEVESGTAIIWSASLLHEVLPVTRGRRFMVGTHMSGGAP